MSLLSPFQLLELNIISAQDLAPVLRRMKTYAIVWVHPDRKLTTRVDSTGGNNPTWNDKFVFRVDDAFLYSDTSAVMIEIYGLHWFRDVHVGTVRVLISNLIPLQHRPGFHGTNYHQPPGMRFVALQVRRATGRPQGILNIGVALLDGSMRSMPLYTQMDSSAVGYKDLMGEEDPQLTHLHLNNRTSSRNPQSVTSKNPQSITSKQYQSIVSKPTLRRSKSDTSSMVASELKSRIARSRVGHRATSVINSVVNSVEESVVNSGEDFVVNSGEDSVVNSGEYSVVNGSDVDVPITINRNGNSTATSMLSTGSEEAEAEAESEVSIQLPRKAPKTRFGSMESSEIDPVPVKKESNARLEFFNERELPPHKTPKRVFMEKEKEKEKVGASPFHFAKNLEYGTPRRTKLETGTPRRAPVEYGTPMRPRPNIAPPVRSNFVAATPKRSSNYKATPMKSFMEYGTPMRTNKAGRPILTESELGPSPSEVAANLAKERTRRGQDAESSILSEWSFDTSSVEGLRSKLDRWRTELPPLYDLDSTYETSETSGAGQSAVGGGGSAATGGRSTKHKSAVSNGHNRRHSDGEEGLFSCFSVICGVECSIVCGSGASKKKRNGRSTRSSSVDTLSAL